VTDVADSTPHQIVLRTSSVTPVLGRPGDVLTRGGFGRPFGFGAIRVPSSH
jgi:hypothetical protein